MAWAADAVMASRLARSRRAQAAEGRAHKAAQCAGVPPAAAVSARLRRAGLAAARRASIVERGAVPASVPCWSSQDGWLDDLAVIATQPAVDAACQRLWGHHRRVPRMLAATVTTVMGKASAHADHATGRHLAVASATLAAEVGCCTKTVQRCLQIVAVLGRAVEASRGTRGPGGQKLPSVWHLITPKRAAENPDSAAPVVDGVHLPPLGGCSWISPVKSYSPSVRAGAPATHFPPTPPRPGRRRRCWRTTPRPLALQRLAGQLVASSHGIGRGHIGAICDAMAGAGIDPNAWTARQLSDALNADMRATGSTWPDHIEHPAAFLAVRLRRVIAHKNGSGKAAASLDNNRTATAPEPTTGTTPAVAATPVPVEHDPTPLASGEHRRACMADIRATLQHRRTAPGADCRRTADTQPPSTSTSASTGGYELVMQALATARRKVAP